MNNWILIKEQLGLWFFGDIFQTILIFFYLILFVLFLWWAEQKEKKEKELEKRIKDLEEKQQ